jgi:hypothetical protein
LIERIGLDRQRLIRDYKIVFEALPQIKRLALDYWEQIKDLTSSNTNLVEAESAIFLDTVVKMSEILLEDDNFQLAMGKAGVNPEENAIIESVLMIEVVLDVEEEINSRMQ